ncbi:hypothetical protein OPQ81_002430 [Rhizoctonia solani]|nr:hypothetical protein OPQ81_002430 [Rhizoctonia solani]
MPQIWLSLFPYSSRHHWLPIKQRHHLNLSPSIDMHKGAILRKGQRVKTKFGKFSRTPGCDLYGSCEDGEYHWVLYRAEVRGVLLYNGSHGVESFSNF